MRNILISGASRGIGNSIAIKALKDGHSISLGLRNLESIKGTLLDPKISGEERIHINKYNALDELSAKEWVENSVKYFGSIDTVIHSAGVFYKTEFLFTEDKRHELDELWKVNLMGPWILSKAAWNYISESQRGRVIAIVSMSGKRSKGNLAGYSASKFALMGLCQTMRNEGWGSGIRVTAICPGWVNTKMSSRVKEIRKEEMTQPDDIALICSNILKLSNSCVPFEVALNCNLEK